MNIPFLLYPLCAMVFLTLIVTLYLATANSLAVLTEKVHIKHLRLFNTEKVPENLTTISQHYKNLYELPILFYVWILTLLILGNWTQTDVYLAWAFVGSRFIHSLIRIPNKQVHFRFYVFLTGFGIMVFCWIRFFMNYVLC